MQSLEKVLVATFVFVIVWIVMILAIFMFAGKPVGSPQHVPDIVLEVSYKNATHANISFASVDPLNYGINEAELHAVLFNETYVRLDEMEGILGPESTGRNGLVTYYDADLDERLSPGDYFHVSTEPSETYRLGIDWPCCGMRTVVTWTS